jgi:hypothetical protein
MSNSASAVLILPITMVTTAFRGGGSYSSGDAIDDYVRGIPDSYLQARQVPLRPQNSRLDQATILL